MIKPEDTWDARDESLKAARLTHFLNEEIIFILSSFIKMNNSLSCTLPGKINERAGFVLAILKL
jgi:hypothetical protein